MAAGHDTISFMHQTEQSHAALKKSLFAMAPILRHPRGKFSTTQLKGMKARMLAAYNESLHAEEAILIAKGKMAVGHKRLPKHITSAHIARTIKHHKKVLHKILKKIKAKLVKKVDKHAKALAKKFAKVGSLKKNKKLIRRHARKEVKKLLK